MKISKKIKSALKNPSLVAWHFGVISTCQNSLCKENIALLRKNRKSDKVVLVGNGPSLNIPTLEKLKSFDTFAFNKIYLTKEKTSWRPSYYMLEDPHVIRQFSSEVEKYLFDNPSIIPFFAGNPWEKLPNTPNAHYYRYKNPSNYPKFSTDVENKIYCGFSVTYSALQLAVALGYKKITFVGVDFKFDTYGLKVVNGSFVGSNGATHFLSNYRQKNEVWSLPRLEEQTEAFSLSKSIMRNLGIEVYNSTVGGNFNFFC